MERTGVTNVVFNLIAHLDRELFTIELLTLSPEQKNSRREDFEKLKIPIHQLNLSRIKFLINAESKFKQEVALIRPDIIHSHGIRPDYLNSKISSKEILRISTAHNNPFEDYTHQFGVLGKIVARLHTKFFINLDVVIGVSKTITDVLVSKRINGKNILNGVNDLSCENIKILKNKDNDNIPIKFVYSANFIPRKNHKYLLDAFSHFDNDVQLILLGEGSELEKLKNKYSTYKNIKFLGFHTNISEYLLESDYYISSSLSEGLPMAAIEGMSYNLGMILSNIPQHKELNKSNNNHDFLLFNLNDINSLHDKIKQAIAQKRNFNTRQTYLKFFSSDIMSSNYQYVYEKESKTI